MARLPNVLLVFAAVSLLSSGGAVSTMDKFKPVRQYPADLSRGDVNAKRLLRNIDTREMIGDDREEERVGGIKWKVPLLTSAEKKASKAADKAAKAADAQAAKEREAMEKHGDFFEAMAVRNEPTSGIVGFFRSGGYTKKEASELGRLYETYYKANPNAYH